MKVSQVMEYMGVECIIRGDQEYNDQLLFDALNVEILDGSNVDDATFHAQAAVAFQAELVALYGMSLQRAIDDKAREKQYDNGFACASYISSSNETWQNEAQQFVAWRDSCWEYAQNIQSQVEQGQISAPTLEEFLSNVPELIWN
jgi:hypothetical protein